MKADLHVHTWHSSDGLTPPSLLLRVAARKHIRVLAITDHNRLTVPPLRADVILVPGEEIMTNRGEIIGLGIAEEIPGGLPPEETVDRIREQGGLVVVPHPYDFFRRRTALLLHGVEIEGFHAVEVLNARYVSSACIPPAYEYAKSKHCPMLASSDAHTPWEVGAAYTLLPDDVNDVDDVLAAIRRGKCVPCGKLNTPLIHVFSPLMRALHTIGLFKP